MQEEMTYEQALQRLEELTNQMERSEIGIDEMAERLKEAQQLLKYCRERLASAEKNCESLLHVNENE